LLFSAKTFAGRPKVKESSNKKIVHLKNKNLKQSKVDVMIFKMFSPKNGAKIGDFDSNYPIYLGRKTLKVFGPVFSQGNYLYHT
jgi:hypothetical protein